MAEIVCCVLECQVTSPRGLPVNLHEGQYWPADDPVVLAYPMHFTSDLRYALASTEPLDDRNDLSGKPAGSKPPVEQATAAPGEQRSTTKRS